MKPSCFRRRVKRNLGRAPNQVPSPPSVSNIILRVAWIGRLCPCALNGEQHQQTPTRCHSLVAFPGVGNIGKMAVDSVCELHESVELVRLHPVGLPPHAHLDEDGLLAPPHLSIRQIQTPNGTPLITLTGKTSPPNQVSNPCRRRIDGVLPGAKSGHRFVLAGMFDKPENKETFAVASSASFRIDMEAMGVDVRRDKPNRCRRHAGIARINGSALRTQLGLRYRHQRRNKC